MSKKDFIELADIIRLDRGYGSAFTPEAIELLASFCKRQNSNFMKSRWLDYIAGECGPSGGKIKAYRCAVCGKTGPEHGHYDAHDANTHKFVCGASA